MFDEYVVPVKFFGPGQHSAYVGHTQQYQLEDPSNVEWVIEPYQSYMGFIKKEPKPA